MSAVSRKELRDCWIRNAEALERRGHFAKYTSEQREEVLRKGYLGAWPPDQAISIAKTEVERGFAVFKPKFVDEMRDPFGVVGDEVRAKLLTILEEIPPETYEPPRELEEPPGSPFKFRCKTLGCEVYFKFQVAGRAKKARVLFWSCHPPIYRKREGS